MRTLLVFGLLAFCLSLAPARPSPYVVKKGDTLRKIAREHHLSLSALRQANPQQTGDLLHPGDWLELPIRLHHPRLHVPMPAQSPTIEPDEAAMGRGSHDVLASRILKRARRQLGVPYVWGGTSLKGADCSGFVMSIFHLFGIPMLRTADCQYYQGKPVPNPSPGDLVFFTTYLPGPSHVGIYLGNDHFIHASSRQKMVVISSLNDKFFHDHYIGARRFF